MLFYSCIHCQLAEVLCRMFFEIFKNLACILVGTATTSAELTTPCSGSCIATWNAPDDVEQVRFSVLRVHHWRVHRCKMVWYLVCLLYPNQWMYSRTLHKILLGPWNETSRRRKWFKKISWRIASWETEISCSRAFPLNQLVICVFSDFMISHEPTIFTFCSMFILEHNPMASLWSHLAMYERMMFFNDSYHPTMMCTKDVKLQR